MKNAVPAHRRHDNLGVAGAALARTPGRVGRDSRGQPIIYQCGFLDFAHGGAVAGSATGLWRME